MLRCLRSRLRPDDRAHKHRTRECAAENAHRRRWLILLVLCISLLVIVIVVDNSILNVAIPSIVDQLGASTS